MSARPRQASSDEEHRRQEEAYADAHVDAYFREMHQGPWPLYRERLEERILALDPRPARVLDIGVGPVPSLPRLYERAEEYVGVDQSTECLRRLQASWPRARVVRGDAEAPPVEGPFDVVIMLGVLHHLPHPERAIERARALLREGGLLVCMEPSEEAEPFMDSPNERGISDEDLDGWLSGMDVVGRWAWFDMGFWMDVIRRVPPSWWSEPSRWGGILDQEQERLERGGHGSMNFVIARRVGVRTNRGKDTTGSARVH